MSEDPDPVDPVDPDDPVEPVDPLDVPLSAAGEAVESLLPLLLEEPPLLLPLSEDFFA